MAPPYYLADPSGDSTSGINMPWISGTGDNPALAKVTQLMSSLESVPTPQPPHVGIMRSILGAIGDGLTTAATIRQGGTPQPGIFERAMMARQEAYRKALDEANYTNVGERNKARIDAYNQEQETKRALAVANIKSAAKPQRLVKSEFTRDVNGETHRFRQFMDPTSGDIVPVVDPNSGELVNEMDLGPAGYAPAIMPGSEPDAAGSPQPGIFKIPRGQGKTTRISGPGGATLQPQPPQGVVTSVAGEKATLQGLDVLGDAYVKVHDKTKGDESLYAKGKQMIGTAIGESRVGGAFQFSKPYAEYTASKRASLNAYIKSVTGAQFSIKELKRYDSQYPEPWDPPDLAKEKLQDLAQRSVSDMQTKLAAYPSAGSAPGPLRSRGPAFGKILPESSFDSIPVDKRESEKQRFIKDGGTITKGQ